jgi:alpha-1,2-mannosyltransferase
MDRALDLVRSGEWLTRGRTRLVATAVLIACAAALLYLVGTANGLVDVQGRPLGTDFSSFYAAGTYALDGKPEAPFDLARQHAREQQLFGPNTPFYSWFYPPFFLFVAGALALMPYATALAVWQAVTLGLYLLTIRAILSSSPPPDGKGGAGSDPLWILLAFTFPAVLVNLCHGQNGFLTAALLGGALIQLERRPIVAGVLFGLLAYKPQFGLMIPLALLAKGGRRTFTAAAATVALLCAATVAAFGPHVWAAFLDSTRFTRLIALEQGDVGWYKIQSVFAWARMWGATIPIAYAVQGTMDLAVGAALIWLWRSPVPYALKAAALCLAAMLATPFALDYDMMALAPAIAFFAADGFARGFGPWEKTALAVLWLTPLIARNVAFVTLIPLGVPAILAVFILLLRRSTFHIVFPMASSSAFLLK